MGRLLDEDEVIDIINFECGKWTGLSKTIEKEIKALPFAQPEREKGGWIDGFMCSVCCKGYRSQPTIRGVPMFKYCPECGADMRGKQDG